MMNTSIHLALAPNGMLMDKFYLVDNKQEKHISVTLVVASRGYTVDELKYNNLSYIWDNATKSFRNGNSAIIAKKDKDKPDKVNLFKHTGESCKYEYLEIAWNSDDEGRSDAEQSILGKIPADARWILYPYTERDLSCRNNFIGDILAKDRLVCDAEEVARGDKLLKDNLNETDPVHLVNVVNNVCLSSLRKLSYQEKIKLFTLIAKQQILKEISELAVLRLMNALYTDDYKAFFEVLEQGNNELIKHLIKEIDDASIYFWTDKKNYTNFVGALVTMFNQSPEAIADRWPSGDDDFAQRVVNLNPVDYDRDVSSLFSQSYISKRNGGDYDKGTGRITLYDIYTTTEYGMDITPSGTSVSQTIRREKLVELSPLAPVIIVPETGKIPLIQAALDGYDFGNGAYLVPAIFLEYNADKIRNDYIEKGIITTLDVATIALSGGTTVATKVHWVRRTWAIMEVAGAVGNIAVNVADVSPELRPAVDAYNMAMGIIGVKNLGKGVVNFARELPDNVKTLVRENKGIRDLLAARYIEWKTVATKLDHLTDAERKLVTEQVQVWKKLGIADDVDFGKIITDIVDEYTFTLLAKDITYLPGPRLPEKIRVTFENSTYTNRKLSSNEIFYKYHGVDNRTGKKYAWYTNKKYATESELRQKLAIRDDWGVQIEFVTEFDVPAGTWVSEGKAASQGIGYLGQDYQAVILNTPNSWIIRTDKAFK
jgi:hypothetical protein